MGRAEWSRLVEQVMQEAREACGIRWDYMFKAWPEVEGLSTPDSEDGKDG